MQHRRTVVAWIAVIAFAAVLWGCGAGDASMTEIQRVRSGMLEVVLLSAHGGLRHGQDMLTIEFRSSEGALVDAGTVRASANMPMPGMPMLGSIDVRRTDVPGRYTANTALDMAGTWRLALEWEGAAGRGSVTFSGTVQ